MFDEVNLSELLLMAQEMNPNAHRGLGREVLARIASGEDMEVPESRTDKLRLKIMTFVDAHFDQVEPLVSACPAKTRSLRACFQCTDVQVLACASDNPIIFQNNKEGSNGTTE